MDLEAIAYRLSSSRIARKSLLEVVRDSCPDVLPDGVGGLIGRGGQGEAYALGPDKVLKVGLAKTQSDAEGIMEKLDRLGSNDGGVFVSVFEHGLLCDVEAEGFRADSGTAYFYVMERLTPMDKDDARRASKILTELADIHATKGQDVAQLRKKFHFVKNRELKQDAKAQNQADGTDEWNESNIDGGITAMAIELFDKMIASGMKHVDMNSNNVMKALDGSLRLIDMESTYFLAS